VKRYLGIPLKELVVGHGNLAWLGSNAYVNIRLNHLNISNDHPWWCRVEVGFGKMTVKVLAMGDSEREVRATIRKALAAELKDVRDLLGLLQKLTK
jgi:hypothetical protein